MHALLTGSISIHAGGANVRIAFDSSRGIFIPIPWDLLQYPITSLDEEPEDFLKFVARVPELQERALHILWEYVEDEQQRNDDLQFVQNTRNMIERPIYRDSYKAISNVQVYREMNHYEQLVPRNFDFLQKELSKMFTNDL